MEWFIVLSIIVTGLGTASLLTNVGKPTSAPTPAKSLLPNTSEVMVPEVVDCRKANYTPQYSCSCLKLFNRYGKGNDTFVRKYPCCVCSYPNGSTCYSGAGGYVGRNIRQAVIVNNGIVSTQLVGAATAIITNQTQFTQKLGLVTCLTPSMSDCTTSQSCTCLCEFFVYYFGTERGLRMFNSFSRCCYCGEPLFGGCLNCFCATGTNYITAKGKVTFTTAKNKTVRLLETGLFFTGVTKMIAP